MTKSDREDPHKPTSLPRASGCFGCQTRDRAEWCVLSESELGLLNRAKVANVYEPGQVIFYQGNPCMGIHCVESGTVALRKFDGAGNQIIARLFHPGDTLGYLAFFADGGYTGTAEAVTRCRVCFVDRTSVRRLVDANPTLGLQFLKTTATNLREAEESRLLAATLPLKVRLSHLLLVFKDRFGVIDDDGQLTIELPLSRQDLASMLGSRPESLSRTIKQLETAGAATFAGRQVIVPDLDLLLDQLEPDE